jgi:prepilin-type N-terminal cleavage/methylation domain-containing protein
MLCTQSGGRSNGPQTTPRRAMPADDGFTLIEVVIAMFILVAGLLGLAHVFYMGVTVVSGSSAAVVAREKAREAIESVHAARDTGTVDWNDVRNDEAPEAADCPAGTTANGGGIFLKGSQHLGGPGADGLVNTEDDTDAEIAPGRDNVMGTEDDIRLPSFMREINICDVTANPNLRMIIVTIRYDVPRQQTYRLTSYVSKFS